MKPLVWVAEDMGENIFKIKIKIIIIIIEVLRNILTPYQRAELNSYVFKLKKIFNI